MTYQNFKIETDADGIAVVTWDIPGRSMNVLDATTIDELGAIVDATTADAAVKGVVITSGKEAFSAGADLAILEGMRVALAPARQAHGARAAQHWLRDAAPTPVRPRRGLAAILLAITEGTLEIVAPCRRPVGATADSREVRDVVEVVVRESRERTVTLLFDPEHNLEERILNEQLVS